MKKHGMTIAETLVTLIIVGVVGALCIPSIISSFRKESYSSLLSTAVSNFETAMSITTIRDVCDSLFETDAWNAIGNAILNKDSSDNMKREFAVSIDDRLGLTYKEDFPDAESFYGDIDVRSIDNNVVNIASVDIFGEAVPYIARTGAVYFIHIANGNNDPNQISERDAFQRGGNLTKTAADVIIDVNGNKKPNTIGRDIFGFVLSANGTLHPMGSVDYAIKNNNNEKGWDRADSNYACTDNIKTENGFGCTARLIENKYKIDY